MSSDLINQRIVFYVAPPILTVVVLYGGLSSGTLASEVLIFAMAAMACNLLLGYSGLMSFGQGIFFGIGSYSLGWITVHFFESIFAALIFAVLSGVFTAALVGWISIRQRGVYFVLLTLALAQAFYFLAFSLPSITGGDNGLNGVPMLDVNIANITLYSNNSSWKYFGFVSAIFCFVYGFMYRIVNSTYGKTLVALRENEDRLTALGYRTQRFKLIAFMISGGITALAGALYAMMTGIAALENISLDMSMVIAVIAIIGGAGNIAASIIGAAFWVLVSSVLSDIWPRWLLLFGVLLMCISLFMQRGLWGLLSLLVEFGKRKQKI